MFAKLKPYGWQLFGFLFFALGAAVFLNLEAATDRLNSLVGPNPQCSWRTARGTVTGSELRNHFTLNGEDDWQFTVRFTYDVEGSQHSAQQQIRDFLVVEPDVPEFAEVPYLFQACEDLADRTEAVALFRAAHDTSQFIPGRPVVVYFNPANSAEGVLVPGLVVGGPMPYGELIAITASCLLPLAGIAMIVKGLRKVHNPSAAL